MKKKRSSARLKPAIVRRWPKIIEAAAPKRRRPGLIPSAAIFGAVGAFSGLAGVALSLLSVWLASSSVNLSQIALGNQEQSAAWQILSTVGPGSTGKAYALETTLSGGRIISGVDISCGAMHGTEQESGMDFCERAPDLRGMNVNVRSGSAANPQVELLSSSLAGDDLSNSKFDHVFFLDVDLSDTELDDTTFLDSDIENVSFARSRAINTRFDGDTFGSIDFSDTLIFTAHFTTAIFKGDVNVSGSSFCYQENDDCNAGTPASMVNHAWYYEDDPPADLDRAFPAMAHSYVSACERPKKTPTFPWLTNRGARPDDKSCHRVRLADVVTFGMLYDLSSSNWRVTHIFR